MTWPIIKEAQARRFRSSICSQAGGMRYFSAKNDPGAGNLNYQRKEIGERQRHWSGRDLWIQFKPAQHGGNPEAEQAGADGGQGNAAADDKCCAGGLTPD